MLKKSSIHQTNRSLPVMTQAAVPITQEIEVVDEQGRHKTISIPGERPLTIYLDKTGDVDDVGISPRCAGTWIFTQSKIS